MSNPVQVSTGFTLNPKVYDFLKWISLVVLPAVATLLLGLGALVGGTGWTISAGVVTLVDVFFGSLVKQSSTNYGVANTVGNVVVGLDENGAAEIKRIEGTQEIPLFEVGRKVQMNVVRDHTLRG